MYLKSDHVNRSVDDNWNIIEESIKEAIDNYIPQKMSKTKCHLPWVSPAIKRLMNKHDPAYKSAKCTGKPEHRKAYKQLRNSTLKHIRDMHEKYVNEIVGGPQPADPGNSIGRGVKRAWSYLKLLRAESTGIPTLFWNNRVCAYNCAKAEALHQQCESVFTCEDLYSTPSLGPSPYPEIPELFVSELGVMKLLWNIDSSKAAGPDLLPARILKEAAVELTPILTALFRQSYDSGLLPADWKKANVSAIYKKGPKSDPKNYRPVSLTTLTCKIMEHIVCSHLSRHLSANSIITPLQHGFWRGYSVDICHSQMG